MRQGEDGLGGYRPPAGRGSGGASRATNAGLYANGPKHLRWTNFHHRRPGELLRNDSAVFRKGSERFRKPESAFAKPAPGFASTDSGFAKTKSVLTNTNFGFAKPGRAFAKAKLLLA